MPPRGRQQGQRQQKQGLKGYFTNLSLLQDKGPNGENHYSFRMVAELKRGGNVQGEAIDFFYNGPRIGFKETDQYGVAYFDWTVFSSSNLGTAKVKMRNAPYWEWDFTIDFGQARPKAPELKVLDQTSVGTKRIIHLIRAGADGKGIPGKINYFEAGQEKEINASKGRIKFERDLVEKEFSFEFFLPENPDVKSTIKVPAKEKGKVPFLKVIRTIEQPEKILVRVARIDSEGNALPGKFLIDDPEKSKKEEEQTDDEGFKIIEITKGSRSRTIVLNPSGRPNDLSPVDIPAQRIIPPLPPKCAEEQQGKPKAKFSDRLRDTYRRGRQG